MADYVATASPYSADPTGAADSTAAIQKAIDDAYQYGGGTVWLPSGTYKVTSTIHVLPYVTLRGDWRDPDVGTGAYGTVISAQVASGASGAALFDLRGNAGADGLTVYYPNQSASSPTPYNWSFRVKGSNWSTDMADYVIQNVTLLNSYKGIGISPDEYANRMHQTAVVRNVKGSPLSVGFALNNASNVDQIRKMTFDPKYWSNAGSAYNAPTLAGLRAVTRASGVAYSFIGDEWDAFDQLTSQSYNVGVKVGSGAARIAFEGIFMNLTVKDSDIAVSVAEAYPAWGDGILRSTLEGSSYSVKNDAPAGYVKVTDSTLTGPTSGKVITLNPGTSPTSHVDPPSVPRITGRFFTTPPSTALRESSLSPASRPKTLHRRSKALSMPPPRPAGGSCTCGPGGTAWTVTSQCRPTWNFAEAALLRVTIRHPAEAHCSCSEKARTPPRPRRPRRPSPSAALAPGCEACGSSTRKTTRLTGTA